MSDIFLRTWGCSTEFFIEYSDFIAHAATEISKKECNKFLKRLLKKKPGTKAGYDSGFDLAKEILK